MKFFSSTKNTFMAEIRTPIKSIVDVFNARTEGVGLNVMCRIFNVAKNTVAARESHSTAAVPRLP